MHHVRTTLTAIVLLASAALAATSCSSSSGGSSARAARRASATASTTPPARPTAEVDRTVEVDGARMHITCRGEGDVTVVLVAGFGNGGDAWAPITDDVASMARVCTYDRFGTGTSDPAPATQTFATQARSLQRLLRAAGEPGPYVVVGHSFGGVVAATYTSAHPDDVEGLLLLDASPADWNRTTCAVPDLGTSATDIWKTTCEMQSGPTHNPESLDGTAAFAGAAEIDGFGSVPLIVDQAADEGYRSQGLPADVGDHLTEVWDRGQRRWASMSTDVTLKRVPGTTHQIYVDQPAVVIDQIRTLVEGA